MRRTYEVDIDVYVNCTVQVPNEFQGDEEDFYNKYISDWFGCHADDADIFIDEDKATIKFKYSTYAVGEYVPADETSNGGVEWQFTTHPSDYNVPSEYLIDFDYDAE
jgi:hypothetical protein